jgi:rod shape-determining protein MreD
MPSLNVHYFPLFSLMSDIPVLCVPRSVCKSGHPFFVVTSKQFAQVLASLSISRYYFSRIIQRISMQPYIRSIIIIIGILLLQTTFLPFISLGGYLPDLFLIYLVYLALQRGQIEATITGFIIGLFQDIIAVKFLGLAALAKTIGGFVAGYFYNENTFEQTLGSYRYVLLIGLCSIVQNLVYFTIFFQGSEGSFLFSVLELTFGMTFYTCVIGVLPMFYFSRKFDITWAQ